jgi:hypothetical protein
VFASEQPTSDGTDRRKKLLAVDADRAQGVAGIREYTNGLMSKDVQREREEEEEVEEEKRGSRDPPLQVTR